MRGPGLEPSSVASPERRNSSATRPSQWSRSPPRGVGRRPVTQCGHRRFRAMGLLQGPRGVRDPVPRVRCSRRPVNSRRSSRVLRASSVHAVSVSPGLVERRRVCAAARTGRRQGHGLDGRCRRSGGGDLGSGVSPHACAGAPSRATRTIRLRAAAGGACQPEGLARAAVSRRAVDSGNRARVRRGGGGETGGDSAMTRVSVSPSRPPPPPLRAERAVGVRLPHGHRMAPAVELAPVPPGLSGDDAHWGRSMGPAGRSAG